LCNPKRAGNQLGSSTKTKKIYIYIKLEKKAAAVFSVHAHSNVLNKKAGREKAREREEPGEQLHKGKKQ